MVSTHPIFSLSSQTIVYSLPARLIIIHCLKAGLDIGYVPAGPHPFFRSLGQFGPQQLILWWPVGPVAFRYQFFLLTYRVPPCDGLTYKYFHPQSYSTCAY